MLYRDYQSSKDIGPGKNVEESLALEDVNRLAQDNWKMFSEFGRYRLDVCLGNDGEWGETVSLEFEVGLDEVDEDEADEDEDQEDRVDYLTVNRFRNP